jgi:diguanylate cyclase
VAKISAFPPVYTDPAQHASENLRRALPLINRHKTPVNPVNYAVWYEYVSGSNQQLNSAIDTRLSKDEPMTEEITQFLYEKYVLMGMPERIEKTNNGMRLIVDNTMSNINKAEAKADACTSGLNNSRSILEGINDVDELKGLITDILSQTEMLIESSQDLKQELVKSSQDMLALKAELEEVKKTAITDGLTGLLNRGAFNKELDKLCELPNQNASLILFDLDHFKRLNDTYGHLLGDKVIQFFAGILKKHGNETHPVARYGGEEMAMIVLDRTEEEVIQLAETIRETLANSNLKKKGSEEGIGQITVSIGISWKTPEDIPTTLIDRADQALYLSKANGRNQVNVLAP